MLTEKIRISSEINTDIVGMPTSKRIELLEKEFDINMNSIPNHNKFGTLIKVKYVDNVKTYEPRSYKIEGNTQKLINQLINNEWIEL
jgi:tRNA(His) 5'-end guanylyltransferase